MPITSPQLDDLRFDRLVEELIRRIPVYAPEWTDFNESDPGITLVQLFAYVAEQIGYRLNQVPEKNHIELLKLLGVRLRPPHAAATRLALTLSDPKSLSAYVLSAGAQAKAKSGDPPPVFETDSDLSVVPCEVSLLVTTKNPFLTNVLLHDDGSVEALVTPPEEMPVDDSEWLSVRWDGKKPKLKQMPTSPITLLAQKDKPHAYLWIGLMYNDSLDAGFRGVRVTLTVQYDDDEQPSQTAACECDIETKVGESSPLIDWLYYYDATQNSQTSLLARQSLLPVTGRIDDSTNQFTKSGIVRFTVPSTIGPISDDEWVPMRPEVAGSALAASEAFRSKFGNEVGTTFINGIDWTSSATSGTISNKYRDALVLAEQAADDAVSTSATKIEHPLRPVLRDADKSVRGWLRITLPTSLVTKDVKSPKVRILTFNAVSAVNATTLRNEMLGISDGRPGQSYKLANGYVLDGSLELGIQEGPTAADPLTTWRVGDLDAAGPFDRVFDFDPEAGEIYFGDGRDPSRGGGRGGRIPPLVPSLGRIVALRYRSGGGVAGEVDAGAVQSLATAAAGIDAAVNYVAARGGREVESVDEAKLRARRELSTRNRAVTASDFEWIAMQTPQVRVARAHAVPLRTPLASGTSSFEPILPQGEIEIPAGPSGLDSFLAHGAVSVVVVPDAPGAKPLPTPSFLEAVCRHLNNHRLVTTEVYVVPPQYCQLHDFVIEVKATPGYARAQLQDLVEAKLAMYLHVLTGGKDSKGFPFGGQIHIADLITQILRTPGIERVESLTASFTRTKSNAIPRIGTLVQCPAGAGDSNTNVEKLSLESEENVSIDVSTLRLTTVD